MAFPGTGKIWMNGKLVDWADATIHIALARHPLRQRRVRRRALLRDAEGLGLLPPRRAHAPAAAVGQDLPDGVPARSARAGRTPCSTRSAPTSSRPATSGRSSTAATRRSASTRCPARSTWPSWCGNGAPTSARTRSRQGVDVKRQLVDAHGAEHAAGDGQGARRTTRTPRSSRWRRSPTATPKASRSTSTATSAKAAARTSSSSATASSTRRRSARRSSAASRATRS